MPSTSVSGTTRENVMQLPASMNMAPPPEIRRTTCTPYWAAASSSTSLRSDWNDPMTTAGFSHSQKRRVGPRRPAASSRPSTSSRAACLAGSRGPGSRYVNVWSPQPVEWPSARRTATATARASNPAIVTGPESVASVRARARPSSMAAASSLTRACELRPVNASLITSSASSGSRKKSPLTRTSARCSSTSRRSTATSLPPGTLYSPRRSSLTRPGYRPVPTRRHRQNSDVTGIRLPVTSEFCL